MLTLFTLFMALAPGLLLLRYYYRQDRQRPEPQALVIKIFLLGVASIAPVILIELAMRQGERLLDGWPLAQAFFRAFFVAALCEEWIKYRLVLHFAYRRADFDEVTDGVVYTVVASLGFACLENVMYVMGTGISTAVARALTAVPMHALASGLMGSYIGRAKFAGPDERKLLRRGLAAGIAVHGLYDFIIFSIPVMEASWGDRAGLLAILIVPLLGGVFVLLRRRIAMALKDDRAMGRS